MNNKIYKIRNTELSPKDAALLWRFTAAHRDHDPIQNWRELRDSGLEKIEEDSVMDVIRDQYEFENQQSNTHS
jgi:hypothetical protein